MYTFKMAFFRKLNGVNRDAQGEEAESKFNGCHEAKSHAGKWFQHNDVRSVGVFDPDGAVCLWLRKLPDGRTVVRVVG